jgi:hypothetical protein
MLTNVLKSNNLKTLEWFLENKNCFQHLTAANSSIINNKKEAFQFTLNKIEKIEKYDGFYEMFFEKCFLKACEYNNIDILKIIIQNKNFYIKDHTLKIGFSFSINNKKIFTFLNNNFRLKKEDLGSIIFSLIFKSNHKNKSFIYNMTDLLIQKFGFFPSQTVFELFKTNNSFIRLNLRLKLNKSDFKLENYLFKYEKEHFIIKNYKELMVKDLPEISDKYNNVIKKIKINNF